MASQLRTGVTQIFSTGRAFAALKSVGSVITWGNFYVGGESSGVASQLRSGVTQIFSNRWAFAALKSDGSVITWGDPSDGGDSRSVASQLRSGVVAFANPFTDDRLVGDAGPPAVFSLAATRASQAEHSSSTPFLFTSPAPATRLE
ncbi:MAG: hypothetical protein VKN56_03715 [Cyanobacteriota bacterium]|nr:hypothetical protein [Cyanobacteriota bacterium]